MSMVKLVKKALVIGCFFSCFAFGSTISVQPLTLDFKGSKSYKDVIVYNTGKSIAYVTVSASKAINYGKKNESWVKSSGGPSKFGLIVSPNRLVIPKNQTRVVRVLRIGQSQKDQSVYRINFSPAQGKLEKVHVLGSKIVAGVRVVVSYNVIAKVSPVHG